MRSILDVFRSKASAEKGAAAAAAVNGNATAIVDNGSTKIVVLVIGLAVVGLLAAWLLVRRSPGCPTDSGGTSDRCLIATNGAGAMIQAEKGWLSAFAVCVRDADRNALPGVKLVWRDVAGSRKFIGLSGSDGCASVTQIYKYPGEHHIQVQLVEHWNGLQFTDGDVPTYGKPLELLYLQL